MKTSKMVQSLPIFFLFFIIFTFVILGFTFKKKITDNVREILYVGTFTERSSQGIYVFEFDRKNLEFKEIQTIPWQISPSFLEIHPNKKYLISVYRHNLQPQDAKGTISSFLIDSVTGKLILINQLPSLGDDPCHISFDHSGKYAFVSHYGGGCLSVFPIGDDGVISADIQYVNHNIAYNSIADGAPSRVHSSLITNDNRFLLVADLGLNRVFSYPFDAQSGKLDTTKVSILEGHLGDGPRHMSLNNNLPLVYIANELGSAVSVAQINPENGSLTELQHLSTLPHDFKGKNAVADIHASPDGRFLYVSNRGDQSLAIFSINSDSGLLSPIDFQSVKGDWPRNFMITENGKLMLIANQRSDRTEVFTIDSNSGKIEYTGKGFDAGSPTCLKLLKLP